MEENNKSSRRSFLKSSALVSGGLLGSSLYACNTSSPIQNKEEGVIHFSLPSNLESTNLKVSGLLFSQIGYNLGQTARVVIRMPEKGFLPEDAVCKLIPNNKEKSYQSKVNYWGELWKSHWWVIEFTDITEEGEWQIEIAVNGAVLFRNEGFRVAKNILWKNTYEWSSVDMLERRKHFSKVGGWQDAGTLWVECPAQSAAIISLCDLVKNENKLLDDTFLKRVYEQITIGSDYLVKTQEQAKKNGHAAGAMCHDLLEQEKYVLANDTVKAVVALYKSVLALPSTFSAQKATYKAAADLGLQWLLTKARPSGDTGFNWKQRGLSKDVAIPKGEWLTRDLISLCWAALEGFKNGNITHKEVCIDFATKIIQRQFTKENKEQTYYGHFKEFDSLPHSQSLWVHGVEKTYGADVGGIFPNYILSFFEMLDLWPEHKDAPKWKIALHNYAYGFLIPTCKQNPFYIVPLGVFGKEGPLWFTGPFHGTNTIYGYTAALALKLSKLFNEPMLKEIAIGNLQWIAGLNAGITKESLKASVVYSEDIPEDIALPSSMICDIGNRSAGTWFRTRGVVCNGFSTGTQFVMDVDPIKENDGPFSFTDEDWIPHSAAWLSGLIELNKTNENNF